MPSGRPQSARGDLKGKRPLRTVEGAMHSRAGSSAQSTDSGSSLYSPGLDITTSTKLAGSRRNADDADLSRHDAMQSKRPRTDVAQSRNLIRGPGWVETDTSIPHPEWKRQLFENMHRKNTFAIVWTEAEQTELCLEALSIASNSRSTRSHIAPIVIVANEFTAHIKSLSESIRSNFPLLTLNVEERRILSDTDLVLITTPVCLNQGLEQERVALQNKALVIFFINTEADFRALTPQLLARYYSPLPLDQQPRILTLALSKSSLSLTSRSPIVQAYECVLFRPRSFQENETEITESKLVELTMFYEPLRQIFRTPLLQRIIALDTQGLLRKEIKDAKTILRSLGPLASDIMWKMVFEDLSLKSNGATRDSKRVIDGIKNAIREIGPNVDPGSLDMSKISPKFNALLEILKPFKLQGPRFRGIIVVQHRVIAEILAKLLHNMWGFLKPYAAYGRGPFSNPTTQEHILAEFHLGSINLIILTRSFEDLEFRPVTSVIVFDLLDNYIAFANARAQADRNNSHFVIMAERKHDVHRRVLSRLATKEQKMTKWIESVANMGSSPPPRTLLESLEGYSSDSEAEVEGESVDGYIQDPTTCARIYPKDAVSVIYKLVSGLGKGHGDSVRQALFQFAEVTDVDNNGITEHTCTVLLPSIETYSQPKSFSGAACLSRALARKAACFELCQDLFRRGLLDSRLFPRGHSHLLLEKQRPSYLSPLVQDELSDHDDDLSPPKSYIRRQPNFWLNTLHDITGKLFPVRISIKGITNQAEPHNSLLLLTRVPLPPLSVVELFNLPNQLECRIMPMEPFIIHQERLESLHKYTVRLIRALTFRSVDCVGGPPPYYLAPLKTNGHDEIEIHQSIPLPEGENLIDWDAIFSCLKSHSSAMQGRTSSELRAEIQDGILQNRMPELSRKFEAISVRADLNPRSRPDGEKDENNETYLHLATRNYKLFEGLQTSDQPLIQARLFPPPANNLTPQTSRDPPLQEMLIPELCYRLSVPASTFRTALLIPSIMRRLNDILLTKEVNGALFDHKISEKHLLAALTLPAAAMTFNDERLEFLGDAFLKYASSAYLYVLQTQQSEGVMHFLRQSLISNSSLMKNALRCDLPSFIHARSFMPKAWLPLNFETVDQNKSLRSMPASTSKISVQATGTATSSVSTKRRNRKRNISLDDGQRIPDKSVADVMEAVLGAAYLTGGVDLSLWTAKRLNIPFLRVDRWSDFNLRPLPSIPEGVEPLAAQDLANIQAILKHRFANPMLLAQALTHRTRIYSESQIASYDRLEFLGDAILDFVVAVDLFHTYHEASPGMLTSKRSSMVTNNTLAAICTYLGLHHFLVYNSSTMGVHIRRYEEDLTKRRTFEDQQLSLGRKPTPGGFWAEVEAPKVLSDMLEAIIGAIYVSDGFKLEAAEHFYNHVLRPFYLRYVDSEDLAIHPTRKLTDIFDAHGCHRFEITKERDEIASNRAQYVSEVVFHDIVLARAWDVTGQGASRRCALLALDALKGDPAFLQNCTCHLGGRGEESRQGNFRMDVC